MKDCQPDRRKFLKLMLSVPVVLSVGLEPGVLFAEVKKATLSPKDALRTLIYLFGPWSGAEKKEAEDFARRFLAHASGAYLPGMEAALKSLSARFSSEVMAIGSISLQDLSSEEKMLLTKLLSHLYTFAEVRFDFFHELPWGECLTDRLSYTRPPK